jgi:tripartite-type tricarboxylate transporter receptor subunit TctC
MLNMAALVRKRVRWLVPMLCLVPAVAMAQPYPSKPVRMIAPFPATGGVDVVARQIAQKLSANWGQQVIVDNRPGATGIIGTDLAAKAAPDGYTILMGNAATQAINVSLYKLPYDPVKDFAPITLVARVPEMLVVNTKAAVKSVSELIELAKEKPKQLTFGSAGVGSPPHLAAELFQYLAHVQFVHVPYKGSAPALVDLVGGQIDIYFGNIFSTVAHVKAGRLRALGVTSAKRAVVVPDIPTIAEAGLPGYEEYNWYGVLAPRRTPAAIVEKLHTALATVLSSPDVRDPLVRDGAEVVASTPKEFADFIQAETKKYAAVIQSRGIKGTK